jgi:hypothetical protein
VLTPCAAHGIFRYYDNWSNGNAQQIDVTGATPRTAVVDFLGNPKTPTTNPNGTPFTGQLHYVSVFGPLAANPTAADCSDAVVQGAPWDSNRKAMDPTGYVAKVLGVMPAANNYEIGEGLNTAGHRWVRGTEGTQNRFGFGFTDARKQANVRLDHNISRTQKINGTWTMERVRADYGQTPWDTARFDGVARRLPQVLGIGYTATLSPHIVNEARWGMRRTGTNTVHGLASNPDAREFVPEVQGIPVVMHLGLNALTQAPVICFCGGQPLFQRPAICLMETSRSFRRCTRTRTPFHGVTAFTISRAVSRPVSRVRCFGTTLTATPGARLPAHSAEKLSTRQYRGSTAPTCPDFRAQQQPATISPCAAC